MIRILRKFFRFCNAENRRKFYQSIFTTVLQCIFESLKIPAVYILVDAAISTTKEVTARTALTCFGIMVISVVGSALASTKGRILQTEAGYRTCAQKRIEVAEHLRYVPMGYFNDNSLGQVLSVTTNTLQALENVATRAVMLVSSALITSVIITLVMMLFDFRIGLILVAGLAIFMLVNSSLLRRSQAIAPAKDQADRRLVEKLLEYIQGISEVKSYNLTGGKAKELNRANEDTCAVNTAMEMKFVPLFGIQNLIIKGMEIVVIIATVSFCLKGTMALSVGVVLIISSFIVYSSLEGAAGYSSLLHNIDLSVDKVNAILEYPQMKLDGDALEKGIGDIQVDDVSFSYGKRRIIDHVSFRIPNRTTTAIVGPSGSGKTTLTSLIARFWDVDEGRILINGKDVRSYSYDSLMSNFSFVFQKVYLFNDTIANNIRFSRPEATLEEVIDAAKKACCHEFIQNLPAGYDTVIGEDGVNLSGGERQRISIARAIMKDASIIVMDEATANVDPENEADLMTAIRCLTEEKTVIMIAHRLKTVEHADQILVVEDGWIAQQGRHEALMREEGIYQRFIQERREAISWKLQG